MNISVIHDLITRLFGDKTDAFSIELIDSADGKDCYEIDNQNGTIVLRGNHPVSIAAALGRYLKDDCHLNLLWCGTGKFDGTLPAATPCRHVIDQQYRVYMNYCTFNYSASWWTWERWEREIDLMALYGINLPLAAVGIENVWHEMLLELGMEETDALAFLAGPAFSAWQWMTNLEGFCGPMPKGWLKQRKVLARRILARMREYGMTPIQQGFSGVVPEKIKDLFPACRTAQQSEWCGIKGVWQLDPTDPLFDELGMRFLKKQQELFGAYGFYAADPFHESVPPVEGEQYLKDVGQRIYSLFKQFDPRAVWVMQAWSIQKPIATQADKDGLLVLDLNAEKYVENDNFWGYPFVAGTLHNFGGRIRLHGDMQKQADNHYRLIKQQAANVCGTGLFMEAVEQNPLYYTLAFEQLTNDTAIDLDAWLENYAYNRYGVRDERAVHMVRTLVKTAYQPGTDGVETSSIFAARPAVDVKKSGPNDGFNIPYSVAELLEPYRQFLKIPSATDGFRYDAVDILRQMLSDYGYGLYKTVAAAFKAKDLDAFNERSAAFLQLLADADRLLATRNEFRLSRWLDGARAFGETEEEQAYYEHNAKVLITLWGHEDRTDIFDYSWREWSGLIREFYAMRWETFFTFLRSHLENGTDYDESGLEQICGREAWRCNAFYDALANKEVAWTHARSVSPSKFEEELPVAAAVFAKYNTAIAQQ